MSIKSIFLYILKFEAIFISIGYSSGYILTFNERAFTSFVAVSVFLALSIYFDYLQDLSLFKAKKEVEISMSKIELIVGAISDGILVLDQHLNQVLSNSVMKDLTQGEEAVFYLSDLKYYQEHESDEQLYLIDDISKGFQKEFGYELSLGVTEKLGKIIEWKGRVVKWDHNKCVIVYARDISKVIRLENESKENKYKSLLLRTVSHELRTPTNSMLLVTEQLREDSQISQENQEKIDVLYCSCSYLLCLINDLLDYSQIVAGSLKISSISFDLRKLINDCFTLIKIQTKNRPIILELTLKSVPEIIQSDPNRLKQILLNLLSNSVKFTISGTITLHVSSDQAFLNFMIQDTGVGIPEEKIPHLFKQFGKLEDSHLLNPQGTGLGLFISSMLTFKLGGDGVKVTSNPGVGSSFSFKIDLIEGKNNLFSTNQSVFGKVCIENNRNSNERILIVDDEPFNTFAIQKILEKEGFLIEFSNNGNDAIRKIMEEPFSLILMDCEMPVLDGWETTKKLKKMQSDGKIKKIPPIIGYTSHASDEINLKCLESGMDGVIVKPCPRAELVAKVNKWLKHIIT
jgi:signal transduction histidine kinase/CheY-like chemotaxis protein